MQPLKYLTADHPYLVIRDNNNGTCNIKVSSQKPEHYDPVVVLKKILAVVERNLTYVPDSKKEFIPGNKLREKLKTIAKEIVYIHGNEKRWFKKNYKEKLEKHYRRINSAIRINKEIEKDDRRQTWTHKNYELYHHILKHPPIYSPVSLGSSNYFFRIGTPQ
jgi:hypothetical protein